jgi:hypothetical protein
MGLGGLAAKVAAGSGSGSSMGKLACMACMAKKCKERMGSCSYRLVVELPAIKNKVFCEISRFGEISAALLVEE